jgi:cystathionine beta-lyase
MLGGSLNAADCYTLERSLKTLALRVERQNDNAMKLATWLEQEKKIQHVYYPGLESHPQHVLARSQMNGFGGVLSFEIEALETRRFFSKLKMIKPAISLGGVESTICSPVETSHQKLSPEERRRVGITDSLVRLSVGVEAVEDIMDDIQQALKSI